MTWPFRRHPSVEPILRMSDASAFRVDPMDAAFIEGAFHIMGGATTPVLRRTRKDVIERIGALGFKTLVWLFVLFWIGQVLDRYLPFSHLTTKVVEKVVDPRGPMMLDIDVERTRTCRAIVRYNVKASNHLAYFFEMDVGLLPLGHYHFQRPYEMPSEAPDGPAKVHIETDYRCRGNLLETERWPFTYDNGTFDIVLKRGRSGG